MICNTCGTPLKDAANFCSGCGGSTTGGYVESSNTSPANAVQMNLEPSASPVELPVTCITHPAVIATGTCRECGSFCCQDCLIRDGEASYCLNCSASLIASTAGTQQPYDALVVAVPPVITAYPQSIPDIRFAGLSPYYQQEFSQIAASGESYKGKWNWAAFFFGSLWALTKGAWATFLVHFGILLLVGGVTCGFGLPLAFVFPIIYGLRGNYIYYCAASKGRQIVF